MATTYPCPTCEHILSCNARTCPNCGELVQEISAFYDYRKAQERESLALVQENERRERIANGIVKGGLIVGGAIALIAWLNSGE